MNCEPTQTAAFHITDVSNLPAIFADGGLLSDAHMCARAHTNIGYAHVKARRMTEIRVDCCDGQPFVGQFVPFYYCPRSPMLYVANLGSTGRPAGCQSGIVHLVFSVADLAATGRDWAISDGNAGAFHTLFYRDLTALNALDWTAIRAGNWKGITHQKQAEFLVRDFVPWGAVRMIGCHNGTTAAQVRAMLTAAGVSPVPTIDVKPDWYYR